jgi:uncharacterized membrane protein
VNPAVSLALATAAFVGTHLLMSHPLRPALVARLGGRRFSGVYSVIAIATFIWMIVAWGNVGESAPLWQAPEWWWRVASAIMLLASILLIGSLIRNPAFPRPGAPPQTLPPAVGVFAITRHPMNWSFMIWALVHISLWGSARNLIVAGGILLLALIGSIGQDRKKLRLLGDIWRDWMARTSFVPFAALLAGRARWSALKPAWVAVLGGLALWLAMAAYHDPMVLPFGDLSR